MGAAGKTRRRARDLTGLMQDSEGAELMPSSFESDYPAITRWIKEYGRIEIAGFWRKYFGFKR